MQNTIFGQAKARLFRTFGAILGFSVVVNFLMLTGSIYMLQVYDRVIPSRSVATLGALTAIMLFLYLMMGIIDGGRSRIASRAGARFQSDLDAPLFQEILKRSVERPGDAGAAVAQKDLENIARITASPVFLALFDIPWIPLFLGLIFFLHPLLGVIATAGGIILTVVAILGHMHTRDLNTDNMTLVAKADRIAADIRRDADLIQGLGMRRATFLRWGKLRRDAILTTIGFSDRNGTYSNFSRIFRQVLQSLILGAGAWLVIEDKMTAGGMIASSILMGRALSPVDMAIGQWGSLQKARQCWGRISEFLSALPEAEVRTELPHPKGSLRVDQVTAGPAGKMQVVLRGISFAVEPGEALAVIGPSGAGKSSLARLLIGSWKPYGGQVTLDGAPLAQYDPDTLGRCIGYLPQSVRLLEGTIAENIARLDPEATSEAVIEAAKIAGVHDMILSLPKGYDTPFSPEDPVLSGGQMQRIALARAVYGSPSLLILDEPNSNMDNDSSLLLSGAIRAMKSRGAAILIMAHRPSAITECDLVLVMDRGSVKAFGPKSQILREVVPAARPAGEAKEGVPA